MNADVAIEWITDSIAAMTSRVDRLEATVQPPSQGGLASHSSVHDDPESDPRLNEEQVDLLRDLAAEVVQLAERVRRVPSRTSNANIPDAKPILPPTPSSRSGVRSPRPPT